MIFFRYSFCLNELCWQGFSKIKFYSKLVPISFKTPQRYILLINVEKKIIFGISYAMLAIRWSLTRISAFLEC